MTEAEARELKAEIEWVILLASMVEHKPAWVSEAADAIVEKVKKLTFSS